LNLKSHSSQAQTFGFSIIENVYSAQEIEKLITTIESADSSNDKFRKSKDVFAIRQFLKVVPDSFDLIFNEKLKTIIDDVFGKEYFLVKSIYFDKPASSNWYVPYHQDLTISVDKKLDIENYGPWTVKQNQYAVQPPMEILESNFTIRIHLDDTDAENGALKVIPSSHSKQLYRSESIDWTIESETICNVKSGGIMVVKPLLIHSSSRTTNQEQRRVIHLEFSKSELPEGLNWSEKILLV
jgi:ectoine hydroxylase-related dioxygenase (phytanoyl-CoA dioxygenase family)